MAQLNKNISVWRGDDKTPPPTDFHLWVKESGSIWLKLKGSWQCVGSSEVGNLEDLNNKITAIEKVYREQQKSIDDLENRINYINNGVIEEVWDGETKKLVYNIKMGENTFNGSIKASNIFQVKIGREDASVNENG